MAKLILASNSPRRKQLLHEAGFSFEVLQLDVDEIHPDNLESVKVAEYLAHHKNINYRKVLTNEVIITADTVVILENQILGKPANKEEAIAMLSVLSGETHQVITGVCISDTNRMELFSDVTEVTFYPFTKKEIEFYILRQPPFDKAGAYGIQDWIGLTQVEKITGSYFNVMGLPVNLVYQRLSEKFGISPDQH